MLKIYFWDIVKSCKNYENQGFEAFFEKYSQQKEGGAFSY